MGINKLALLNCILLMLIFAFLDNPFGVWLWGLFFVIIFLIEYLGGKK